MKNYLLILVISITFSCNYSNKKQLTVSGNTSTSIITNDYELIIAKEQKGLLIIFPGAGATSKETKEEFNIVKPALKNGISILLMNYRSRLWIEDPACKKLEKQLNDIINTHHLKLNNLYIGGISIGGNTTLILSDYLIESNSKINPKGVFIVDSPLDLYGLYESSIKDINREDFSEKRLAEPKEIIQFFESEFGENKMLLTNIQKISPYTFKTNSIQNIINLKNIKTRFYTEPDKQWWKTVRQTDYESTNAYYINKLTKQLQNEDWNYTEYITTTNKGYRANGERNPHSWSIIDVPNLLDWILER